MDDIVIRQALIADSTSPHQGTVCDIGISNGIIQNIGNALEGKDIVEAMGNCISPGWVDLYAVCSEPGEEWSEDLESLARCAANGGYTHVATYAGKTPIPDHAAAIRQVCYHLANQYATLLPLAAATVKQQGSDMTEMYDLAKAGAVGFTNGDQPFADAGSLMRILQYAAQWDIPVFTFNLDPSIAGKGSVNESANSMATGIRSMPALAETLAVAGNIRIAEFLNVPLHLSRISCAESVQLIREARNRGARISADVAALNLAYTDAVLSDFDTNWKVMPPLRSEEDRQALIAGLLDGTIDAVVSNHNGRHPEAKQVEWDYADYGATMLQTTAACLSLAGIVAEHWATFLAHGPRRLLRLPPVSIAVGNEADLTLFNPTAEWTYTAAENLSRSNNSPLLGLPLHGRAMRVFRSKTLLSASGIH